jgi:hypothetical protein
MFPAHNYSRLRRTRSRRQKPKSKPHHSAKIEHRTTANTSIINRFHEILRDLKRPGSRFLSYTMAELEPICQQMAIQQMSSATSVTDFCPFICIFCQNLIYEPITLYCGHTFCEQCIKDEEFSSDRNCPRCPDGIQGQIQSSIVHAREKSYGKNRFMKELLENSGTLKTKCKMIVLCHKGQMEYSNKNYQKAIDIYSEIIDRCKRKICFLFEVILFEIFKVMMIILYYIIVRKHMQLYNNMNKPLLMLHELLHSNLNGQK